MLDPEEEKRFDAWLASQSDMATFFLDSIDELKLTLRSFEQALRRFNRALAGQLGRARIIITTRPIPFDQQMVRRLLPVPEAEDSNFTADGFADIATGKHRSERAEKTAPIWRNVGLLPLTDDQIRQMAIIQKVADVDGLMADIRRRNAEDFARRPQDLIELCADWNNTKRIRTHREQVAQNVAVKLLPRRAERAALSGDKALEGARRLALAALLARKLTIRHSAEADRGGPSERALDPAIILHDWTAEERETLLERPLFGFASYGRVRFHHRSVIEYLAAEQIDALLTRGMPVKAAKRLLFAETTQGQAVVRPSMRPVAAWLAGRRPAFFREVVEREPEVALNFGDPQSLGLEQRREALHAYVTRYGSGGWRGLRVPFIQAHRFVSPELADDVSDLWHGRIENPEVRDLMLTLIALGPLPGCERIAADVAMADGTETQERYGAIDALIALKSPLLGEVARLMETQPAVWNDRLVRGLIPRLFPEHLSVDRLCRLLKRVQERADGMGDLSWSLPQVIAGPDFPRPVLEPLCRCLSECISEGVTWTEDWPPLVSPRPFLAPALAEVCMKLIDAGGRSADMLRSMVLALRFGKENSSRGEPVQRLREAVGSLSATERETAFWVEDEFLQSLHREARPFDRLYRITHDGTVTPDVTQDSAWVTARLADPSRSPDDRGLLLEVALRCLRPDGVAWQDHVGGLKSLVSDRPELLAKFDDCLKPAPEAPKIRQWKRDIARRRQQEEKAVAKAHASWVAFWKEIATNPDEAFGEERAYDTAWNLWQAMERVGANSRSEGWNRRFIEGHFGKETADRLRATLAPIWRKDPPTLPRERKPEERRSTYVRWQLGLAALAAESEAPDWASKLSMEEAEAAARHIPLELNGFPAWMEALVSAHPDAVDRTIGRELTFRLEKPACSPHWFSSTLQNIAHATPAVAGLFLPRLRHWLDQHGNRLRKTENLDAARERLRRVLDILIQHGDATIPAHIRSLARQRLRRIGGRFEGVWLPVLLQLDPAAGVDALERILSRIAVSKDSAALDWFGSLFCDGHGAPLVDLSHDGFTPDLLLRLARQAYIHVRPTDDVHHEGSFSPDRRDDAERARGAILSALLAAPGPAGWAAKLKLASDPTFEHFRDRALAIAVERAAKEADRDILSENEIAELNRCNEAPPTTFEAMFALLRDRLDDLDELLLEDVSPRENWAAITVERIMRREIARELRNRSNGVYTVDQEAATADEKETDIRLRSMSGQHAVIELKIGEKRRSAAALRAALRDQLVEKYMASDECRVGCLMITIATNRSWTQPGSGTTLDFLGLIEWLNAEGQQLVNDMGGRMRLLVRGFDLRPRLTTERARLTASPRPKRPASRPFRRGL